MNEALISNKLFKGINSKTISEIIDIVPHFYKKNEKEEAIYSTDLIDYSGLILSGEVTLSQISSDGREYIIDSFHKGEIIGESYNLAGIANESLYFKVAPFSNILFMDLKDMIKLTHNQLQYPILMNNLVKTIAETNIRLNKKILLVTQKTLRDKLMAYFRDNCSQNNSKKIKLSMTREHLANLLFSERSSVCRELTKMQLDNLIRMNADEITLLK